MAITAQLMSFNRDVALDRVGGDECLLKEVVELFLLEYPQMMADIEQAVRDRNAHLLERSAHSLKGSLSTIGAESSAAVALALEMMGRFRNLDGCEQGLLDLQASISSLDRELNTLVAS
jgi:HPt (histidine-containing phosphotransfer) domain-containing protein